MNGDSGGKTTNTNPNLQHAVQLVHATCCLAGSASYLDDGRADLRDFGIVRAVRDHEHPCPVDWLVGMLSFEGSRIQSLPGTSPSTATSAGRRLPTGCRAPIVPEARRVLAVLRLPVPQRVRHVRGARPRRRLPVAAPPAPQRPPQPDGVQPVPVHAGCRR